MLRFFKACSEYENVVLVKHCMALKPNSNHVYSNAFKISINLTWQDYYYH